MEAQKVKHKTSSKKKKNLKMRRWLSAVCLAAAVGAAVAAVIFRARFSMFFLAAASVIMLIEAAVLFGRKKPRTVWCVMLLLLFAAAVVCAPAMYHTIVLQGATNDSVTELRLSGQPSANIEKLTSLERLYVDTTSVTDFEFIKKLPALTYVDAVGDPAFDDAVYDELHSAMPDTQFVYTAAVTDGESANGVINASAQPMTADEIIALKNTYPNMRIVYSLALWGGAYGPGTAALILPDGYAFDAREIDTALDLLSGVTNVDLGTADVDAEGIESLKAEHPDTAFTYTVKLWGTSFSSRETGMTLPPDTAPDIDGLETALRLLPELTVIDLSAASVDEATASALTAAHPDISFIFGFSADGASFRSDAEEIAVKGEIETYSRYFTYMPNLKKVDLSGVKLTATLAEALIDEYPDILFAFDFSMFGVKVNSTDARVKLDGSDIGTPDRLEAYFKFLPNLEAISLCDCGLDNAEMESLCEAYPDIRFVWKIHFGKYSLRTDATMFSTALRGDNNYGYNTETFQQLKYCTDLRFLDLGHNHITDISFVSGLTNMKVLILACNNITDISPIAGMNDLEYVELFSNNITDFSALEGKTKLVDLNICRNKVKSIAPIKTCTALERVWIGSCGLSNAQLKELQSAVPHAKINISAGEYPTGAGWREHKHYNVIQKMYETHKYIPFD